MKKAFVLLNGQEPDKFPDLSKYDLVCAIDGAYNHFVSNNLIPDLVTGDFDSINKIPKTVEVVNTPDQNYTDFDKALMILNDRNFSIIDVFGGSGKEHDHFLGNLSTALQWKHRLNINFHDDFGSYFFIENSFKTSVKKNLNISLIPFPFAKGITTKGLKYPINNGELTFGEKIGTRNESAENEISISFKEGNLLIYISNK